ncbi:hypothetical protein OH492_00545 [Vibrio chagasii]|nr:hypothetical protein [Vibrio chagasii]
MLNCWLRFLAKHFVRAYQKHLGSTPSVLAESVDSAMKLERRSRLTVQQAAMALLST